MREHTRILTTARDLAFVTFAIAAMGCEETRTLPQGDTAQDAVPADDLLGGDEGSPLEDIADVPAVADGTEDTSDAGPDPDGVPPKDTSLPPDTFTDASDGDAEDDSAEADGIPDGGDGDDQDAPLPPLEPLAPRDCTVHFSFVGPPGTSSVAVPNEANGWSTTAWSLSDTDADGTWKGAFDVSPLAPGAYGYKLLINGTDWILDPATPMRVDIGGVENSKFYVPDCDVPELVLEELDVDPAAGKLTATVAVRDGQGAPGINAASAVVEHLGAPLPAAYDAASQRFFVNLEGLPPGKHSLVFRVSNSSGDAEPLWLPSWLEDTPFDWRDAVMYFAFVDRFADGAAGPPPPDCLPSQGPTTWRGGDWKGLEQKVVEGYFDDLGVDVIWITAPNDNPDGCMDGDIPGQKYTAYHGYFPASANAAEDRFGGLPALRSFVRAAHERGIRVLVDLVLNHVHTSHPLYAQHPSWFNPSCKCGGACDWNSFAEVCWFQDYLPDIDFRHREPVDVMTDMAIFWAREADLDGFRVDAVKHVYMHMLLTLRARLDAITAAAGERLYMVGETYVGQWGGGGGTEELLIKKYVSLYLLDGQFDFPLYWKLVMGLARDEAPLSELGSLLEQSEGYYGNASVMSTFLGNHDVPRFVTHAANKALFDVWGNGAKEVGLNAPPAQPQGAEAYQRLRLAFAFLFCTEGIPLIYYGDEIGMAGAGDPDNRRMMSFSGWTAEQQAVHDHLGVLAGIRKANPALSRGQTQLLSGTTDQLVFSRTLGSAAAICAINRSASTANVQVPAPPAWGGKAAKDALSGVTVTPAGGTLSLSIPARGAMILVP